MKVAAARLRLLFGAVFAVLLCLTACGGDVRPEDIALEYLERINGGEYEEAYALLSIDSQAEYSLEDYAAIHEKIFNGLGVLNIEHDDGVLDEAEDENPVYRYTAAYCTSDYGDLVNSFSMELTAQSGSLRVKWTPELILPGLEMDDKVYSVVSRASRGEIFSADGVLLAANTPGLTIYGDRTVIESIPGFCAELAPLVGMTAEEVEKCFTRQSSNLVTIKAYLPTGLSEQSQEAIKAVEGAGIESRRFTIFRTYPRGEEYFHIIGYTGAVTKEELDSFKGTEREGLYNGDSIIGKTGLELAYEDVLRGTDGYEVYLADSEGNKKATLYAVESVQGSDLHLTIDSVQQTAAMELLGLYLREKESGSIIQMDPRTGAVTTMVSYPSVDPNLFVQGISQELWDQLNSEAATQPLFNRCLSGLYPPGSILKPFTGVVALQTGAISPNTKFPYEIVKDKWTPDRSDWVYPPITRVENRSGICDLYNGIVYSDNIYFAWAAMEVGEEDFLGYLSKIGFGVRVPFDLTVALSRYKNEKTEFNIKYLADSGYGQGELLLSPLQAACMYSAFPNGGTVYQPYLVQARYGTSGRDYILEEETSPTVWLEGLVDSESYSAIEQAMEDVMTIGTAKSVRAPFKMAGKTGTAEIGNDKSREISWLATYKNEDPKDLVLMITLDTPSNQGGIKTDIARILLRVESTLKKAEEEG